MEGIQKDVERLSADLKDTNRWAAAIDRRVARIEGVMEGYQSASGSPPRELPPE